MRLAAAATFLPMFVLAYVVAFRPVYATDLNNYLLCTCGFSLLLYCLPCLRGGKNGHSLEPKEQMVIGE